MPGKKRRSFRAMITQVKRKEEAKRAAARLKGVSLLIKHFDQIHNAFKTGVFMGCNRIARDPRFDPNDHDAMYTMDLKLDTLIFKSVGEAFGQLVAEWVTPQEVAEACKFGEGWYGPRKKVE